MKTLRSPIDAPNRIDPATSNILVVDDEPHVRLGCVLALKSEGYRVSGEGSAGAVLDRLRRGESCDLLVLDYMMPERDGLQLVAELAGLGNRPAVLLMSAHADGQVVARALELGIVDFVAKPLVPDELRTRVFRMLKRTHYADSAEGQEMFHQSRALALAQRAQWADVLAYVRVLASRFSSPNLSLIEGLACDLTGDKQGAESALGRAKFALNWRAGGPEIFSALASRL